MVTLEPHSWQTSIVAVFSLEDDCLLGTAFCVDSKRRLFLTCYHLLENLKVVILKENENLFGEGFPANVLEGSIDVLRDFVLLEVLQKIDIEIPQVPLFLSKVGYAGFATFGFPRSQLSPGGYFGVPASGNVLGISYYIPENKHPNLIRRLHLDTNDIREGFSGAPIWLRQQQSVCGIIVDYRRDENENVTSAHAIPITSVLPILNKYSTNYDLISYDTGARNIPSKEPHHQDLLYSTFLDNPYLMKMGQGDEALLLHILANISKKTDFEIYDWRTRFFETSHIAEYLNTTAKKYLSKWKRYVLLRGKYEVPLEGKLSQSEESQNLFDLIDKHCQILLIGEPGAGKTAAVEFEFFQETAQPDEVPPGQKIRKRHFRRIPILLQANSIEQQFAALSKSSVGESGKGEVNEIILASLLINQLSLGNNVSYRKYWAERLAPLLDLGAFELIIDGLNETSSIGPVLSFLLYCRESFPVNRYILCIREHKYREIGQIAFDSSDAPELSHVRILRLDRARMLDFIHKYGGLDFLKEMVANAPDSDTTFQFLSVPVFLSLAIQIGEETALKSRSTLLERSVEHFIDTLEKPLPPKERRKLLTVLRLVGSELTSAGLTEIDEKAINTAAKMHPELGISETELHDYLHLATDTGILTSFEPIRFVHQAIQEYLAATWILQKYKEKGEKALKELASSTRVDESFHILCGFDSPELITGLLDIFKRADQIVMLTDISVRAEHIVPSVRNEIVEYLVNIVNKNVEKTFPVRKEAVISLGRLADSQNPDTQCMAEKAYSELINLFDNSNTGEIKDILLESIPYKGEEVENIVRRFLLNENTVVIACKKAIKCRMTSLYLELSHLLLNEEFSIETLDSVAQIFKDEKQTIPVTYLGRTQTKEIAEYICGKILPKQASTIKEDEKIYTNLLNNNWFELLLKLENVQ